MCYKIRQPGESFTLLDQWMQTPVIKELWAFSIGILEKQLHGTDGARDKKNFKDANYD
jgi:hypothetical protein